jgi:alpha-beta hydrolase superfamily lysophospholipase
MVRSTLNRILRLAANPVRWIQHHRLLSLLASAVLATAGANYLAYRHAYALTHFSPGGEPPPRPESISYADMARMAWSGIHLPRSVNRYTPADIDLPYVTCTIPIDDRQYLEAWRIEHTRARGLVTMFHGYSASKASLLTEARLFYDAGYSLLLVDFRGSGGSSGDDTTVGVREAEDVSAAVGYARAQFPEERIVLFGHSMGSVAVMRALARLHIAADVAILECPFDRLLTTVRNRFEIVKVPAFPLAHLMVFWGGWQFGFNGFEHNPVDYARACRCPVLLLNGEKDDKVTPHETDEIYANFPGIHEHHTISGAGHGSFARVRPQEWSDAVSGFLDRELSNVAAAHDSSTPEGSLTGR